MVTKKKQYNSMFELILMKDEQLIGKENWIIHVLFLYKRDAQESQHPNIYRGISIQPRNNSVVTEG